MLTLAYIFLLVMFVGDLAIGIWQGATSLVIAAVVMCGLSSALIFAISRGPRQTYSTGTIQGT